MGRAAGTFVFIGIAAAGCATAGVPRRPAAPTSGWIPAPVATPAAPAASIRGAVAARLPPPTASDGARARWRRRVVAEAVRRIGRTRVPGGGSDCSGFVRSVFRAARAPLADGPWPSASGTEALFRQARGPLHADPKPGELAYFHDTFDRNRDGALGDPFTHVGIVESADPSGRVAVVHFGSHGVARLVLDSRRPTVHRDGGAAVNDFLRIRRADDPEGTRYLAGELLAGFATPSPALGAAAAGAVAPRPPPGVGRGVR